MARSYNFADPQFNEFVFNAIVNATDEQRQRLPFDFYSIANTPTKAKNFVDSASLERRLAMLSYLGIQFSLWVAPADQMTTEVMSETLDQYKSERITSVKKMISAKSFVVTDRETMAAQIMMGQNCHNETYLLNRDYYEISENLKSLHEVSSDSVDQAKAALSEHKLLCKFVLNILKHQDLADGLTGYKELELSVLLYLFIHRQNYVDHSTVEDALYPAFLKRATQTTLFRLRLRNLVDRLPNSQKTKKFTITSKGIAVIGAFLQRVTNQTFNY